MENYLKSYSFRLVGKDVFISTAVVFIFLYFVPAITDFEMLRPIRNAIGDFDITDVYFSQIMDEQPVETDIVIINAAVYKGFQLKEVSDKNYLQLLQAILPYEPRVIGIDHKFKNDGSKISMIASNMINEIDNIFVTYQPDSTALDLQEKFYSSRYLEDFELEKTLRKFQPRLIDNEDTSFHYGVQLAQKFNPDAVNRFLKRGKDVERINFRGGKEKFTIISAMDIIKGNFDEYDIRNKIVMLGKVDTKGIAGEIENMYYTPLNETTSGRTFPDMYKIIVDANIVSMLLTDEYYETMPTWMTIGISFVLCFLNMMFFGYIGYKSPKWYELTALITFMFETFFIGYITVLLFQNYNIESNLTVAIVAAALCIPLFELYADTVKPAVNLLIGKKIL